MNSYNIYFKRIRLAMELDRKDIIDIFASIGWDDLSKSLMDGWQRGEAHPRYKHMKQADFDAFTRGLVEWSRD